MNLADVQKIKQQFGIIGNDPALLRAIDTAIQVAHTDLSVLITGESGVVRSSFPRLCIPTVCASMESILL